MKRQFNERIMELLHEGLEDEELLYLLSLYYKLEVKSIPDEVIRSVNLLKIVDRDYEGDNIVWNIPLFKDDNQEVIADENWGWILDYRELFAYIRSSARGDKQATINKMKRFFAANPHIRKQDVMTAANKYIEDFKNSNSGLQYLQQADYFISKNALVEGKMVETSKLKMYIEMIQAEAKQQEQDKENPRYKVL